MWKKIRKRRDSETYGYYKKDVEWMVKWVEMKNTLEGLDKNGLITKEFVDSMLIEMHPIPKRFPYHEPLTYADTVKTIIDYFKRIYKVVPTDTLQLRRYIETHPNKAESIKKDWDIIKESSYWSTIRGYY